MSLKEIRSDFGLSQVEIARIMGVSQSKVALMEKGELEMKLSEFGKLINALKLSAFHYENLIIEAIRNAKPPKKYK